MEKQSSSIKKIHKADLNNKSNEELISIVLRKDDIARRKDKLINCLKTNIRGLENKVSNILKDVETAEKECTDTFKKYRSAANLANKLKDENNSLKDDNDYYNRRIDYLQKAFNKAIVADTKCFVLGLILGALIYFSVDCFLFH